MATNPTLPVNGAGPITWFNDVNNWRADDAHWLQGRGILRFLTEGDRNAGPVAPYKVAGSVHFIGNAPGQGYFLAKTGAAVGDEKRVFLATNLSASTDTTTQVNLKLSTGTVGVQLEDSRVSISGMTAGSTFVAGRLTASNNGVSVTDPTGAVASVLTREAGPTGALVVSGGLKTNGPTEVVASTFKVTGGTTQLQSLSVDTSIVSTGTTTSQTFATTGFSSPLSGYFNGNLNGNVTSISSTFGQLTLTGSTVANNTVPATPNIVEVSGSSGISLRTLGTQRTKLMDNGNATLAAQVATIIMDTRTPAAAGNPDYPDGCIWVQI